MDFEKVKEILNSTAMAHEEIEVCGHRLSHLAKCLSQTGNEKLSDELSIISKNITEASTEIRGNAAIMLNDSLLGAKADIGKTLNALVTSKL